MGDPLYSTTLDILKREEGTRTAVYDDATGRAVVPGYVMVGHPTIGVGRALDVRGITSEEIDYLLTNDVEELLQKVPALVANWNSLSVNRKAVLVCMAFQMGIVGLKGFKNTLADVAAGRFSSAATRMLQSKWAEQTPARAKRMAALMRGG